MRQPLITQFVLEVAGNSVQQLCGTGSEVGYRVSEFINLESVAGFHHLQLARERAVDIDARLKRFNAKVLCCNNLGVVNVVKAIHRLDVGTASHHLDGLAHSGILAGMSITEDHHYGYRHCHYCEQQASHGDVIVRYPSKEDYFKNPNCDFVFNDDIDTLMTQVPYSHKELLPFLHLVNSHKTLFIGTYGALSDKDREKNLQKILDLYYKISDISYRDVNFCSETLDDSYFSAIKIKSKDEKVLRKTLTLHRYNS